jgi:AcrR family transcriptional regulator
MRADARRNRERVLEAAEKLFAEEGLAAQIEQVAQQAGVGVGTVCRNFPTKQALLDEILTMMCQSLRDGAEAGLANPDPGEGFRQFFVAMADFQVRHRALAQQMAADIELPTTALELKKSMNEAVGELVSRAQASGALRRDVGPGDMKMLFSGVAHAASMAGGDPAVRQRYLDILMDGLRPSDGAAKPSKPAKLATVGGAKPRVARRSRE